MIKSKKHNWLLALSVFCVGLISCITNDAQNPAQIPTQITGNGVDPSPYVNFLKKFKTNDSLTIKNVDDFNKKYYFTGFYSIWFEEDRARLQLGSFLPSLQAFESEITNDGTARADGWLLELSTQKEPDLYFIVGRKFLLKLVPTKKHHYEVATYIDLMSGAQYPTKLIHYSISPDKSRFSLTLKLPTYSTQVNEPVITFYFAEYDPTLVPKKFDTVDTKKGQLKYLLDNNNKIFKLDKSKLISFRFCAQKDLEPGLVDKISRAIQEAVNSWRGVLHNKLNITYSGTSHDCEPPGGVNSNHSIYAWSGESITTKGPGVTLPGDGGLDLIRNTFLPGAAHILLFTNWGSGTDFESNRAGLTGKNVVRHEIGHVLGLGHKEGVSSTMSHYSPAKNLTDYDKETVLELYK